MGKNKTFIPPEACIVCSKEKEINETHDAVIEMKTILNRLDKEWCGNGQPGIRTRILKAEGAVSIIKWMFPSLTAVLLAVVYFF